MYEGSKSDINIHTTSPGGQRQLILQRRGGSCDAEPQLGIMLLWVSSCMLTKGHKVR